MRRPLRDPSVGVAIALLLSLIASSVAWAQGAPKSQLPSPALKQIQERGAEHYRRGEYEKALVEYERALATARADFGADHEQVAIQAYTLGLVAEAARRPDIAERAYRENVRIGEKVYGKDSAAVTQGMEKLSEVLIALGRAAEAEPILKHVLRIRTGIVGSEHSYNASTHAGLGAVSLARGNAPVALASYREAVRLLTGKRETQTLAAQVTENEIRRQVSAFTGLVDAAWEVAGRGGSASSLADETFSVSQRAWITAAASALSRTTVRLAAGDTDLGRRIRRQQDAVERVLALGQEDMRELARWSEVQRGNATYSELLEKFRQASIAQGRDNAPAVKRQTDLVAELQQLLARCPAGRQKAGCEKAESQRNAIAKELGALSAETAKGAGGLMKLHREMEAAEARLPGYEAFQSARKVRIDAQTRLEQVAAAERKAIIASFPDYVALTEPQPLSLGEVQGLLDPSEALITLLVGRDRSYLWAVTRDRAQWVRIDSGSKALGESVAVLRRALDPLADPAPDGRHVVFDVARAHALYRQLLGPVEGLIRDKPNLILVPTGPLTSLPFQVLVTAPPRVGAPAAEALRDTQWLVRRHATTILPSVPSLLSLRRVGKSLPAPEPFLGIGDPRLNGPSVPSPGQSRAGSTALASIYRNGIADLRALRELAPLPETAAELKAIAEALNAPDEALLLGPDATETRVRESRLDQYRVVHFATHGLVAGELSGLAEPALVLTPPIRPSDVDDGLLTASEVAALRLKADWVVLSACNTAAGADVGADALSGLARAFFFAGARALLVSHWAVNSESTVWLTTGTFSALAKDLTIGRAEAFRRTMLAMIDAGLPPGQWAPFVIVGEGAAGR